jgi:hypothetical protein
MSWEGKTWQFLASSPCAIWGASVCGGQGYLPLIGDWRAQGDIGSGIDSSRFGCWAWPVGR